MNHLLHSMRAICNASLAGRLSSCSWKPNKITYQRKRSVLTCSNKTEGSRRSMMLSVGISVLIPVVHTSKARSEEVALALDKIPKTADEWKTLSSPAGFEFMYPGSWIVAFNRKESSKESVNVFVGNFLTIDTFSVQKSTLEKLDEISPDLKSLAKSYILPLQQSGVNITFDVLSEDYQDSDPKLPQMYVVEYEAEICRGQISEGLGGKRLCKGVDDADVPTIKRRHYLGVTTANDSVFYMNASSPSTRWDLVKDDLFKTMRSFVVKT